MLKKFFFVVLCLFFSLFGVAQERIEKIDVEGNVRVPRETVLYYLSMKEGSAFNRDALREDFRSLWSTGFFSSIKIEEKDGTEGKIIKILVEENPLARAVAFETEKNRTKKDIVDWLKARGEFIRPYSFCSPSKIQKMKEAIEEFLLERGFSEGRVDTGLNEKEKNTIEIVFHVEEGSQSRIGEVVFEGQTGVPAKILRSAMKENRRHGILSYITGKDIFNKIKLDEDLIRIKNKLEEYGYRKPSVGCPRIEEITKRNIFFKKELMKKIIIPVEAGDLYAFGEAKIEGNKEISVPALQAFLGFKEGEVYNAELREQAVKEMERLYRENGYFYVRVTPKERLDSACKRVDITFDIEEGEMVYLHRLEFKGNTFTKDKVLRREMLIQEGEMFNMSLFEKSVLRLQRLGIARLEKEPSVQADSREHQKIDITLPVDELQKGAFHFSGGYNDYRGTYVGLDYSTVNFLGAGERLQFVLDHGEKVKNYVFGIYEPYLFDRPPTTLGLSVYYRDITLPDPDYIRLGQGVDIALDTGINRFLRANFTYGYERVDAELPEEGGAGGFDPIYLSLFGLGSFHVSSLTVGLYNFPVDNSFPPSRKFSFSLSCKLFGSFLGGDIDLIQPRFEFSVFHPLVRKHAIGFHAEYQFDKALKDSQVPFWERFYLGGRDSLRGYRAFSVGPRSERGTNIGGEKALVFNFEYIFPVRQPFYAALFYDAGSAYDSGQEISLKNMYTSTGLEIRISLSFLSTPIRLIFAYNNRRARPEDSHFAFRLALGTTF